MAGGHGGHAPVKLDPGVESWNSMRENVYKTFRFTSKTARISFIWVFAVPALTYYAFSGENQKWDWQGKKRTDSLYKNPPQEQ